MFLIKASFSNLYSGPESSDIASKDTYLCSEDRLPSASPSEEWLSMLNIFGDSFDPFFIFRDQIFILLFIIATFLTVYLNYILFY